MQYAKTMFLLPQAIVKESRSGRQFVKFINMLMNDTTFLLDECLTVSSHIFFFLMNL